VVVAGLLAPLAGLAQDGEAQPLWEVGAMSLLMSQQVYPGSGQQLERGLLLPYVVYRGDLLRVDRDNVGLRKILSPDVRLDLGFAAAFGAGSDEIDARRGMPDLGTLVEFGPRMQWTLARDANHGRWRADFPLRGVFDATNHFTDKGMALEPELVYQRSARAGWSYGGGLGLLLGDQRLADTLYGVAPAYATPNRSAYTAQAGLIASRLSLYAGKAFTPHLRITAFTRVDSVAGAANQSSPLVQKTTGASVGLFITYTVAQSQTLVRD
jgi:outer membrane scaffolding protein for murein synthesis (MipA/OmpV family)